MTTPTPEELARAKVVLRALQALIARTKKQAGEIERLRSEAGYVAAADVIAHLTAQRDSIEQATWAAATHLLAGASAGGIAVDTVLKMFRARAAPSGMPSVFVEPFDAPQGTP